MLDTTIPLVKSAGGRSQDLSIAPARPLTTGSIIAEAHRVRDHLGVTCTTGRITKLVSREAKRGSFTHARETILDYLHNLAAEQDAQRMLANADAAASDAGVDYFTKIHVKRGNQVHVLGDPTGDRAVFNVLVGGGGIA